MKLDFYKITECCIGIFFIFLFTGCKQKDKKEFPRIYVQATDKENIQKKIATQSWAKEAFENINNTLEVYVQRHETDPEWIVSRMAMYWKEGERYTQCYLKDQNWDRGEGDAPVPTVRMPGMRTWNKYYNVPLEERIPYNETGDMWGIDRTNPEAPAVLVPYKESGHMIRSNNNEIVSLAENAAFVYWITNDKKYARFAADIFYTWLMGTWYMNPILDPGSSTGSTGGWEPGGICGYYDYEQIHDDLAMHTAVIYDFLYTYLEQNTHPHLKETGKSLKEMAGTVFKRFIDLGMIRGGKEGNWNVNGWNVMIRPILVLEDNSFYEDGKGREYYLHFLTKESTPYHDAIPDILKTYDSVTGLWPESPGYAFSTISMLLDFAVMLQNNGMDIIAENSTMQKAAMAVFPWMDKQANLVNFGDSRGSTVNFTMFERLLTYYTRAGNSNEIAPVAAALHTGIALEKYSRSGADWIGLCTFIDKIPQHKEAFAFRASYSPFHRLLVTKNDTDDPGLMAVLYGGRDGCHLTPNGLALQLYGFGWPLAPDASGYESYWSKDRVYHQSAVGSNTILPGYTEGEITIEAMEPAVPEGNFSTNRALNSFINFADVSAGEKRRVVALVKTSASNGYYVDVFRSALPDNDYIFHHVSNKLEVTDKKNNLLCGKKIEKITPAYQSGYDYFDNIQQIEYSDDFCAHWEITDVVPSIHMQMWMTGTKGRQIHTLEAPYSFLEKGFTPANVSTAPQSTPVLLVRQTANDAWKNPFVTVFEPYRDNERSILSVEQWQPEENFTAVAITSMGDKKDYVLVSPDDDTFSVKQNNIFKGNFGFIREVSGEITALYIGKGSYLSKNGYTLSSEIPCYASVYRKNGDWYYSADQTVLFCMNGHEIELPAGYELKIEW